MKDILNAALKSRTMNFGSLLVLAGLLEQHGDAITALVPDQYDGLAISAIGIVVCGLRFVTTGPLLDKKDAGGE
jgi:hypothetical protein